MLPAGLLHTLPTATAFAWALERVAQAWRRRVQERPARRLSAAQEASLAALDAHTLRDLGLGDWAASRRDGNAWMRAWY